MDIFQDNFVFKVTDKDKNYWLQILCFLEMWVKTKLKKNYGY